MLETLGLTKRVGSRAHSDAPLGDRVLFDDVRFVVRPGEIAVLTGPSGAGKSTFLRILAGLDPVDMGTVLLGGIDVETLSPRTVRRRIAYVAQEPVVFPGTVGENLHAASPELSRADMNTLLERVHLPSILMQDASTLSGGEKQRLAVARALATEPTVLLLDEPTSALDPASARGLFELLGEVAAQGVAVVVVTHDLQAIQSGLRSHFQTYEWDRGPNLKSL